MKKVSLLKHHARHNEDIYDYAAAEGIFTNPACSAVSFIANVSVNYSEVVKRPLVVVEGDFYEEARLGEVGDGRDYNEVPVKSINENQNDFNAASPKVVKPDELYSKPDKVKKENASTSGEARGALYTA